MRLIDADALLDEYCGDCNNIARQICGDDPICGVAMIIKDEPTVEDAVVVVRCKDCKYAREVRHDGVEFDDISNAHILSRIPLCLILIIADTENGKKVLADGC